MQTVLTTSKTASALTARDLCLQMGQHPVLNNVSFTVSKGTVTAIIGPNGAGKTSLLRACLALLKPQRGQVAIGTDNPYALTRLELARRVAYLPQANSDGLFTVLETVLMGRYPHLSRISMESEDDKKIAMSVLAVAGIDHLQSRKLHDLSGGERRLVHFARTLAQQAPLIFLDEPTANLDLEHALIVMTAARKMTGIGTTIIMAMHDLNLAAAYCDNIIVLKKGHMITSGTPVEVVTPDLIRDVFKVTGEIIYTTATGTPQIVGTAFNHERGHNGTR